MVEQLVAEPGIDLVHILANWDPRDLATIGSKTTGDPVLARGLVTGSVEEVVRFLDHVVHWDVCCNEHGFKVCRVQVVISKQKSSMS